MQGSIRSGYGNQPPGHRDARAAAGKASTVIETKLSKMKKAFLVWTVSPVRGPCRQLDRRQVTEWSSRQMAFPAPGSSAIGAWVGECLKILVSGGPHESGRTLVQSEVCPAERHLVQHGDRVVDIGECVHAGALFRCSARQREGGQRPMVNKIKKTHTAPIHGPCGQVEKWLVAAAGELLPDAVDSQVFSEQSYEQWAWEHDVLPTGWFPHLPAFHFRLDEFDAALKEAKSPALDRNKDQRWAAGSTSFRKCFNRRHVYKPLAWVDSSTKWNQFERY